MFRKALATLFLTAAACGGGSYDTSGTAVQPVPQTEVVTPAPAQSEVAMSEPAPAAGPAITTPAPMSTRGPRSGPVASTTASVSSPAAHEDGARRISIAEANRAVENGTAVLVDVRSAENWAAGHAKGAINIPVEQVVARISELPRDKMIITYCA